jgi:hypothetical protein
MTGRQHEQGRQLRLEQDGHICLEKYGLTCDEPDVEKVRVPLAADA